MYQLIYKDTYQEIEQCHELKQWHHRIGCLIGMGEKVSCVQEVADALKLSRDYVVKALG